VIGFMSVEVQVEVDFERARRRAFFGRVAARLRRECSRLLAFDEIGESRHNAFDQGFMPTNASLAERWKRVDRAFHCGLDLPAIRLYKIGDSYFVEDGNHRVSVARYQGVQTIEAEVTEFFSL